MRTYLLIPALLLAGSATTLANTTNTSVKTKVIALATTWEEEVVWLSDQGGLAYFCSDSESRKGIYRLLNEIHHYHALLYQELTTTTDHHQDKAIMNILEHIEKIEAEYTIEKFNNFFLERCQAQMDLKRHSDEYQNDFGENSYDGQIQILETEIHRFMKKLTHRISQVKRHVHHLHLQSLNEG